MGKVRPPPPKPHLQPGHCLPPGHSTHDPSARVPWSPRTQRDLRHRRPYSPSLGHCFLAWGLGARGFPREADGTGRGAAAISGVRPGWEQGRHRVRRKPDAHGQAQGLRVEVPAPTATRVGLVGGAPVGGEWTLGVRQAWGWRPSLPSSLRPLPRFANSVQPVAGVLVLPVCLDQGPLTPRVCQALGGAGSTPGYWHWGW